MRIYAGRGNAATAVVCQVTFHGLAQSPGLERLVRERTVWLQEFAGELTGVRALIDVPHRHRHEHAIRVQLRLCGHEFEPLSVEREGVGDAYALVRETFDVARRRLQDVVREQRGAVKIHSNDARRFV
jgi:hypothetical protein